MCILLDDLARYEIVLPEPDSKIVKPKFAVMYNNFVFVFNLLVSMKVSFVRLLPVDMLSVWWRVCYLSEIEKGGSHYY